MSVLAAARVPAPTASVSTTPRLKHVLAVGQQHHRRSRATGTVLPASEAGQMPEFLIWAPTSFEELKQRANEKVKSLIYNDEFYEALHVDYSRCPLDVLNHSKHNRKGMTPLATLRPSTN